VSHNLLLYQKLYLTSLKPSIMKSYFNEYLESEMNAIKLQGEIDSLAIAFKYVLKIITDEQAKILFDAYWDAVEPLKNLRDAVGNSWESRVNSVVVGIDGRKIVTRSKHSLLNALFQSGGVICAKYATVFIYQLLEAQGYKCNPFKEKTIDMCGMIEYHDECQLAVNPSLIKYKVFKTEDEANEFVNKWKGEQLGSIVEGKNDTFVIALPNPVSQAISKGIDMAVEEVKLTLFLWYPCHCTPRISS